MICFKCAKTGCRKVPINDRCNEFEPAPWTKYIHGLNLATLGVGGLKVRP